MTQRDTLHTNQWLRAEDRANTHNWYRQCLKMTRTARNIPAMYPTAFSAQHATPGKYRIYKMENVKRGMVAYYDNPYDGNPYGHVVTVQGRHRDGTLYCWSNDVVGPGMVSLQPMAFFPGQWNVKFQFAATWLNGVVLDMPDGPAVKSTKKVSLDDAVRTLTEQIDSTDSFRVAQALKRDRAVLVSNKKHFG